MSDYKNKIKIGDNTIFLFECPECGSKRVLDKEGIKAIMLMGGGGIGLLIPIIAIVGTFGFPALILLGMGYKGFENNEDLQDKASKLLSKIPLLKRIQEQGISIFKCPNCGSGIMVE